MKGANRLSNVDSNQRVQYQGEICLTNENFHVFKCDILVIWINNDLHSAAAEKEGNQVLYLGHLC